MGEARAVEMTPEQVMVWRATVLPMLERLCKLQQEVCDRHLGHMEAHDCICGTGGFWRGQTVTEDWFNPPLMHRNEGTAIDFIEQAVREKLDWLAQHKGAGE